MDSETKLLNRPVDEETLVLSADIVKFKEIVALIEYWRWEGVSASSIIYLKNDAASFERETLINSLFEQMNTPRDKKLTYKETEDYVYINFNFVVRA